MRFPRPQARELLTAPQPKTWPNQPIPQPIRRVHRPSGSFRPASGGASSPRGLLAGYGAEAGIGARWLERLAAMLAGARPRLAPALSGSGKIGRGPAFLAADEHRARLARKRLHDGATAHQAGARRSPVGRRGPYRRAALADRTDEAVVSAPPVIRPSGNGQVHGRAVGYLAETVVASHPLRIAVPHYWAIAIRNATASPSPRARRSRPPSRP
jgi:hypothetical protein